MRPVSSEISGPVNHRTPCSTSVKWLKDHPYLSLAIYFTALTALGLLLAYVELSLSHKLIIGCVTGSVLTITFVPFGCLCQVKKPPPPAATIGSPQALKSRSPMGRLSPIGRHSERPHKLGGTL